MSHEHIYHLAHDLVLTLPDHAGAYSRLLLWVCPCGEFLQCQGTFLVSDPPVTVAGLLAKAKQERDAGREVARYGRDERRRQVR